MRIYNLLKRSDGGSHKNFNLLPYISFYWGDDYTYLNIGWLHITFQFKLK